MSYLIAIAELVAVVFLRVFGSTKPVKTTVTTPPRNVETTDGKTDEQRRKELGY